MLKQLQDQLNDKVDYSRLAELEKLLMDKLNELARTLTKQLADKNETKKNLKKSSDFKDFFFLEVL